MNSIPSRLRPRHRPGALLLCLLVPWAALADELRVAVASNFAPTLRALVEEFSARSEHSVVITTGSTGKHFAQISNGAPIDIFFAADARYALELEQAGRALPAAGFDYAQGTLVLWSPRPGRVGASAAALSGDAYTRLAIANPQVAPYGRAAREALTALGLWDAVQPRLVRGTNVAQTLLFVRSGNAELGLVERAQLQAIEAAGATWVVPADLYTPLLQRVALLRDSRAAREFLSFVQSDAGADVIRSFGYALPSETLPTGQKTSEAP